nr:retrotransposon Gag domain-containing protein [Tanacetum cinerariifolium]
MAEKFNKEKEKNEKLKGVKARLNFGGSSRTSRYSESRTMSTREHGKRHRSRRSRSPRPSPKSEDIGGGHWKSMSKKKKPSRENKYLSQPWQEGNQKQNFRKGSFQNQQRPERKQDRFTLLTKTPKEIFALKKGKFKAPPPMTTPVEKQNHTKFCEFHGEVRHNTDECMHLKKQIEEMFKAEKLSRLIKELKRNSGKEQPKTAKSGEASGKYKALAILIVQSWERMARKNITQTSNHERNKSFPPWKQQEGNQKQNFRKGHFRNQQRPKRKQDWFTLLTKTPKEIFALEKGKFKAPPPMTTSVEKRNHTKFCEFHGEVGHNTDEWNARVWFDDLPPESIDSYDDLKKAFLENYLQQKKYIKYPMELHNIKQRD